MLGVSSCLLGNEVRFDGGHQHDHFITATLGQYSKFIPVCPEVECGLPIPREAMRLVGSVEAPRLLGRQSGTDFTDKMKIWMDGKLESLAGAQLDGFIFKKMSPSSGMERVKVYSPEGMAKKEGVGIFARGFMERFPNLPVEEDGRLNDPVLRENFIQRIFVHRRWRQLVATNKTRGGLVNFHTAHKLTILAHNETIYRQLGKLVADAGNQEVDTLYEKYIVILMEALKERSTVKTHTNVLMHVFGYFKKELSSDEKKEILEMLDNYRDGQLPLIVPLTLLKHFVRKYGQEYLAGQVYLNPHPLKLKLLNHA